MRHCFQLRILAEYSNRNTCRLQHRGVIFQYRKSPNPDVRSVNFQDDHPIPLDGEWEFYWNEFLHNPSFQKENHPPLTGYGKIPGSWDSYTFDNQKISPEDGQKISSFHQSGYTDKFQSVIRKNEATLGNFLKFVENLKNYTGGNIETMQKYESQLKSAGEELNKEHFLIQKDLDVLKKYVGFFYKLKIRFS